MPLDRVLISHLDDQDILEAQIEEDVESLLRGLSIKELMDGSSLDSLITIADELQIKLKEYYYPKATQNGISLAIDIEKDGDIKIQDSNDPKLNEALDDKNNS